MKVLIVGGGGREHALAWKIAGSPLAEKIWAAPGNAGIADVAECLSISAGDIDGLLAFAKRERPDLTVIGPEAPLVGGVVDRFEEAGFCIFGPRAQAAQIEGSKAFAKEIMERHGIPTAGYETFEAADAALAWLREQRPPIVVKADGLAAGKGVFVAETLEAAESAVSEIMRDRRLGEAGARVVIEEFLEGEEASFIALTDGRKIVPLASSQDHKRLLEGDRGPNTGGMGAYSPAPIVSPEIHDKIMNQVMKPLVEALAKEGTPYRGVLYAGLMIRGGEISVLEINARFGDPEAQPLLARMTGDLLPLLKAVADGDLGDHTFTWDPRPAVCVVMAAEGYPASSKKGAAIAGLADASSMKDVLVFHAGTKRAGEGTVVSGGRVLGVTALGDDLAEARDRAYEAVDRIRWDGAQFRRDIAHRALGRRP